MKSLYESILSKTGAGIKIRIDEWCQEHKIYNGGYMINSDNTISPTFNNTALNLSFDTYTKLPPYIKFKGADNIDLNIGGVRRGNLYNPPQIDSFDGLPGKVRSCVIVCKNETISNFKIECLKTFRISASKLKRFIKTDITTESFQFSDDDLKDGFSDLKTHGVKSVIMTNDFRLGDQFSSLMNRKAEMNKYKNKFEVPVKEEALAVIKSFFEPQFDTGTLENIEYTQNSKLVKYKDKWYRCKNWV